MASGSDICRNVCATEDEEMQQDCYLVSNVNPNTKNMTAVLVNIFHFFLRWSVESDNLLDEQWSRQQLEGTLLTSW